MFIECVFFVFSSKYVQFYIIYSLQYSINSNTDEGDNRSDSLLNGIIKPKNIV